MCRGLPVRKCRAVPVELCRDLLVKASPYSEKDLEFGWGVGSVATGAPNQIPRLATGFWRDFETGGSFFRSSEEYERDESVDR